jgi:hypothetical protein
MPDTTSQLVGFLTFYIRCEEKNQTKRYYLADLKGNETQQVPCIRAYEGGALLWTFTNQAGHEIDIELFVNPGGGACPILFSGVECSDSTRNLAQGGSWNVNGLAQEDSGDWFGRQYDYEIKVKPSNGPSLPQTIDPRLQIDKNTLNAKLVLILVLLGLLLGGAAGAWLYAWLK